MNKLRTAILLFFFDIGFTSIFVSGTLIYMYIKKVIKPCFKINIITILISILALITVVIIFLEFRRFKRINYQSQGLY